jgi:uncharacterized protein YjiS (DUF1127 family)
MNAPPPPNLTGVNLARIFTLRAEARARLYADGEMDLHTAVDELQRLAETNGLVAAIGQDAVQAIMSEAFAVVRDDLPTSDEPTVSPDEPTFAGDPWSAPSWHKAAIEYYKERAKRPLVAETEPEHLARLRRLMANDVSLERTYAELNSAPGRAAKMTVEALMYSLRERGTAALKEPDTRRRLGELSDDQLTDVGTRLQHLKPGIARAWTAGEVENLMRMREGLR